MILFENWRRPKCYAVKHRDEAVVELSRSGGIFTAVSDYVLDQGGVVYGCVLTDDFKAVHVRAMDKIERDAMRGSKYIQSDIGDTYKNVKKDLLDGLRVLFTGTSCQVAGLKGFLEKNYENLFCVDIVCHGVPSPAVWNAYLRWQEEKIGQKIVDVKFRNKKDFGWRDHVESLMMDNGEQVDSKVFTKMFYDHAILRPCCYECPFKSVMHPGDITIADYWGIEKVAPEFDDNKGVSLVLINNDRGNELFEKVKKDLQWKLTKIEYSMQPPLIAPFSKPRSREKFWRNYNKKGFKYVVKRYEGGTMIGSFHQAFCKVKEKIKTIV